MNEDQNADIQLLTEENQRLKTIVEKTYHFLKRGSINSTWKAESQLFNNICKELKKDNPFNEEKQ